MPSLPIVATGPLSWVVAILFIFSLILVARWKTRYSVQRWDLHARKVNDSVYELHKPTDDPIMQVILFHGLPFEDILTVHLSTWENEDGSCLWPKTWLGEDFPRAHILAVSYNEGLQNRSGGSFGMYNIGENLISDLLQADIGQMPYCPVVLVGHSFGGLVIKKLCMQAQKMLISKIDGAKVKKFLDNVMGIFYYSTPHGGSPHINRAAKVLDSHLIEYFRVLNTEAQQLNHDFNRLCGSYPRWLIGVLGESLPVKSSALESGNSNNIPATSDVPEHVKGLDLLLEQVIEKLKKSKILGFVGMGGLGKTTLAKAPFNELGSTFEYTCFVRDVKLIIANERELKEAVWKDMHCNGQKFGEKAQWSKLRGKKLLLIFDDISGNRDAEVLLDIAHDSSPESRFIMTSRDRELLNNLGDIYPIPFLEHDNSQKLFLSHAFPNQTIPPPKLANLIQEIVKKCEGLPLTLEVLGKYLKRTENYEDWKQTLHALDKAEALQTFDERFWAKLRLSYDGLDRTAQQMFLDVATFFSDGYHEWTLREAMVAWSEAYETKIERLLWKSLVDRSLVYYVEEGEVIRMHEQMRSVGRKIASEFNNNGPCRVREETQALRLLQNTDEVDNKEFHSLRLGRRIWYVGIGDYKAIHIAGPALQKLKKVQFLDLGCEVVIDGLMEAEAMPSNLVLLKCSGVKILNPVLQGRLAILHLDLVEDLLPNSIGQLSGLRTLVLCAARQSALPHDIGHLVKLEHVWFSCRDLKCLPDSFGNLSALTHLKFDYCSQLQALPESFKNLSGLEHLIFEGCNRLQALPQSFGNVSALKQLEFNGCRALQALPESFGNLSALDHLGFDNCFALQALPESFGNLSALNFAVFIFCNQLQALPQSFGNLSALEHLEFYTCDTLEDLPESFGNLSALEHLKFHMCNTLQALPKSFGNLSALKHLEFYTCRALQALPESFGNLLALLEFHSEDTLEALPESFGNLSALKHLQFRACNAVPALPQSFGNLLALEHLMFEMCDTLKDIHESFGNLSALKHLEFKDCFALQALPESFGNLSALKHLEFEDCSALQALPKSFGNLLALEHLEFSRCSELHALPVSFGQLVKLQYLKIRIGQIQKLPCSLAEFISLHHLILDCIPIESIPDYIKSLQSLHTVELRILPLVKELPPWLGKPGMAPLGSSHKIFQIQDGHFTLTQETRQSLEDQIVLLHKRAMEKVWASDYEGALADLCHSDVLEPNKVHELMLWGFLLQERGIVKRFIGDLQGALKDLTAASQVFSKYSERYAYNSWRHRGFVNFLLGDFDSANEDGIIALRHLSRDRCGSVVSPSLGEESVTYMHFRLKGKNEILDELRKEPCPQVMEMVHAGNFTGALAIWEDFDAEVCGYHNQLFFLQERGILKRMVGNFRGGLEDLTTALEIDCDDYECYKHRGYVKYLLGDVDGARIDAERCMAMECPRLEGEFLGALSVAFLEFDLT